MFKSAIQQIINNRLTPHILFLCGWLFVYLPYFIYCPIVEIGADSYTYFYASWLLSQHLNEAKDLPYDIPMGFPVFISLCKVISSGPLFLIILQNIIYVFACLLLIHTIRKISWAWGLLVSIAMLLYTINNFTLRFNTALLTESLYITSLITVISLAVSAYFRPSVLSLFIFSASLILPPFFRSNGIYIYFLVFLFLIVYFFKKYDRKLIVSLVSGLGMGWLILSTFNYVVKDVFFIGDLNRIKVVLNREKQERTRKKISVNSIEGEGYWKRKLRFLSTYILNPTEDKPSFYYTNVNDRYERIYVKKVPLSADVKVFDRFPIDSLSPDLRYYTTGDFYPNRFTHVPQICNINNPRANLWLFANHLVYKAYGLAIWNKLWVIMFLLAIAISAVLMFLGQGNPERLLFILMIAAIHAVGVLIVVFGHGTFQARYSHVSEFLIYIVALLFIYEFMTMRIKKTK